MSKLLTLLLIFLSSYAHAACNQSMLNSAWMGTFNSGGAVSFQPYWRGGVFTPGIDPVGSCYVAISASGKIGATSYCKNWGPKGINGNTVNYTGKLTISSSCGITGTMIPDPADGESGILNVRGQLAQDGQSLTLVAFGDNIFFGVVSKSYKSE